MRGRNQGGFIAAVVKAFFILVFLMNIMDKNQSPAAKLIILPFLLCALFSGLKSLCLARGHGRIARVFGKLFVLTFIVFWFGFLGYGDYLFLKEGNYFGLVFSVPFLIAGIYMIRKYLFGIKSQPAIKKKESKWSFPIVVSSLLVASVLVIGAVCLFVGIRDALSGASDDRFLIYFGAFFLLGGSVFVLGALYVKGVFDKCRFNIMGIYVGAVCVIVGGGIILFQNGITGSAIATIKAMGIWILIPILFIIAGTYLIIKGIKGA